MWWSRTENLAVGLQIPNFILFTQNIAKQKSVSEWNVWTSEVYIQKISISSFVYLQLVV